MIRGAIGTIFYITPPSHYLGYIVSGKVPVILIPGILGKWSFMKSLGDHISLQGHPVYIVPGLKYNLFNIPSSSGILRAIVNKEFSQADKVHPHITNGAGTIENFIEKEDLRGVVLVAHSKGGLIGKYFLIHHNRKHKVLGMIAIATPFSGSAMAKLLPLEPIKELDVDSEIIHDIERHKAVNRKIVSVRPEYDNHVWAEKGSYLEGAHNIVVPVHGHHKVIFDKEVQKVVIDAIEKITKELDGESRVVSVTTDSNE